MNNLLIDVATKDAGKLISRLKRLKSTAHVWSAGQYRMDSSYTLIHIDTTKTEDQLDDWLYKSGLDYVGACTR